MLRLIVVLMTHVGLLCACPAQQQQTAQPLGEQRDALGHTTPSKQGVAHETAHPAQSANDD